MSDLLNGVSLQLLQKSLDAIWLRQQAITNNIANAETPGYKSKKVDFESILSDLLSKNYSSAEELQQAINGIEPKLKESSAISNSENGNNVVEEEEEIELVRAQLQYYYLINSVSAEIDRLKFAINGGR
ncbi:MAG: flagellar basal body rod protein FlgB [Clostridia bacterium]|nr:flagellar basal body rod protein FlgB [Clostridia bacterium]